MSTPTRVVYVHGAGRQEDRELLKRRLDEHLFGSNQLDRTVVAYYSDLLHDDPVPPAAIAGVSPAASDIENAFLIRAIEVAALEAGPAEAGAGAAGQPAPLAGIGFPDPAFLILARIASGDVTAYLFGDRGPVIRQRVREAIPDGPVIVLAHSLGTIVAYDVLSELKNRKIPLFITVGSPLGIANVQRRIGDRTGPPAAIPSCVKAWDNFADPHDPVAVEQTLGDEFKPAAFILDAKVDNRAMLNHDLTGYLDTTALRAAVRTALGGSAAGVSPGGG